MNQEQTRFWPRHAHAIFKTSAKAPFMNMKKRRRKDSSCACFYIKPPERKEKQGRKYPSSDPADTTVLHVSQNCRLH
jgi:hypothetical protein